MRLGPSQLPREVSMNVNRSGSRIDVSDDDSNDSLSLYDMGAFHEDLMRSDMDEALTDGESPIGTNISYPLASFSSTTLRNQTRSPSPTSPQPASTTSSAFDWQRSLMSLDPQEPYTYGSDDDDDNVSFGSLYEYDMAAEEPIYSARLPSANIPRPLVSPGSAIITRPPQTRSPFLHSPQTALSTGGPPTRHRNLMASVPPLRTQTRRPPTPPAFPQLGFTTSSASDWPRGLMSMESAGPPPVYTRRASPLCVVRYSPSTYYILYFRLNIFLYAGLQREACLQRWSS